MNKLDTLTNGAVLRLLAYVGAAVLGVVMVFTGRLDANGAEAWVTSTQTQLGILLTAVSALAGWNVDKAGARPHVDAADLPTVRAAVEDAMRNHIDGLRDTAERATGVDLPDDPDQARAMLKELRARIAATARGSVYPD